MSRNSLLLWFFLLAGAMFFLAGLSFLPIATHSVVAETTSYEDAIEAVVLVPTEFPTPATAEMQAEILIQDDVDEAEEEDETANNKALREVPFYSQFRDISEPSWRKVGCGIASVAMLIDYYSDKSVVVDTLLERGIARNAFLSDAGWTHAGLIELASDYGLRGKSVSMSHLSMSEAFRQLEIVVDEGPVMVSVHYTFDPANPIPHLAVVTGIIEDHVYYNDPADSGGQRSISIEQFKTAWKKRYISIRP